MPAGKFVDVLEQRIFGIIQETLFQILKNSLRIGHSGKNGSMDQLLDLRAKIESAIVHGVIERFHSEAISGAKQKLPRTVPQRKAPHPIQPIEAALTPLLIGAKQDLRVCLRSKAIADLLQFFANFLIV